MRGERCADVLRQHALEARRAGGPPFKVQAYLRAAQAIEALPVPLANWVLAGHALQSIPGVGESIAQTLTQCLLEQAAPPRRPTKAAGLSRGSATSPATRGLVEATDLRGDLHVHTDASDGMASLEAMVDAAALRGLDYVAVTDHTQRTAVARGLGPQAMRRHIARIQRLARRRDDIEVLAGAEVDILKDGRLDLPDDVLGSLDLVVCALHHRAGQSPAVLNRRVLRAMSHPRARLLAHPTGRLIGRRDGMDLDWPALLDAAKDQGWGIELNGQPRRLDPPAPWPAEAAKRGVPVALDSDAHSVLEFGNLDHAVREARRNRLRAKDVLNTKTKRALRAWL